MLLLADSRQTRSQSAGTRNRKNTKRKAPALDKSPMTRSRSAEEQFESIVSHSHLPRPEDRAFDMAYSERKPPVARSEIVRIPQTPNPKYSTADAAQQLARLKEAIHAEFEFVQLLGSTRTASVELVRGVRKGNDYKKSFALKEINTKERDKTALTREFLIGRRCEHENLVKYFRRWETKLGTFFLLEYCALGSLDAYIVKHKLTNGKRESTLVWHIFLDVLAALSFLHHNMTLHLDVKPGNIFLVAGPNSQQSVVAKVGDFGTAWELGSDESPLEGDGKYLAPELCESNLMDISRPDMRADVFSLGMTVLAMATTYEVNGELWASVKNGDIRGLKQMSSELGHLVSRMLSAHCNRPDALTLLKDETLQRSAERLHRPLPRLEKDPLESSFDLDLEEMSLENNLDMSSLDDDSEQERLSKKRRKGLPVMKDLLSSFNDAS